MRLRLQHDSIFQYDKALMHPDPNVKPPRTSRHTHMHAHTVQDKEAGKVDVAPLTLVSFKHV
jgi:hypothetical protein